jgi:Heterokaryon incompatibility protein Het-C
MRLANPKPAMNLQNHRAITHIAAMRAMKRLNSEGKTPTVNLLSRFWALYQGSWLTDMSQVTAFFDMAQGRRDPYKVLDHGVYVLPTAVTDHPTEWAGLFKALWKKECEWSPLPELSSSESLNAPLNGQIIKGYHPYDHFDVVDRVDDHGNPIQNESEEFADIETYGMTKTAREGLFSYALRTWFAPSFNSTGREDLFELRSLGHGLHTVQDFFAHSNFVEILLSVAAKEGKLDPLLSKALQLEPFGTYTSYWIADKSEPGATPIMTGRFDRIDTIATLLKILREALIPPWNDLAAAGYASQPLQAKDLLFEAMFVRRQCRERSDHVQEHGAARRAGSVRRRGQTLLEEQGNRHSHHRGKRSAPREHYGTRCRKLREGWSHPVSRTCH